MAGGEFCQFALLWAFYPSVVRLIDLVSESELDLDLDLYSDAVANRTLIVRFTMFDERGTAAIFITKNRTPEKASSFPRIKIVDRRI